MIFPNKQKTRYLYEENIYFNSFEICEMLDISKSCLSKQLKTIKNIPGCQSAYFQADYQGKARHKYRRRKLMHYDLNTVVAIAYRVNNDKCKKFLDSYHRIIYGLHLRIAGPNYLIPSCLSPGDFIAYANRNCPNYETYLADH